jgi:hypothetical protein
MKTLCIMLLAAFMTLSAGCLSLPSGGCLFGGTVGDTKAYLDRYCHILLVCVTRDHVTQGEHSARSDLHFTGTVVRVYKGNWAVSETISWGHELDDRIPLESNKHTGELFFVFTDTHSDKEIFLDTGDWPHWDKDLAQQIETALR